MTGVEREAAVFIAAQPGGPNRLLRRHQPDGNRRCRGCTTPGTGTPGAEWPCSIHVFAQLAARLVDEQVAAHLAAKPSVRVQLRAV